MAKKVAKKKNPPHRPPHAPTAESRAAVQAMAALGNTQAEMCDYLSKFMRLPISSENTLRRYYATEISLAKTHQRLMVSQGLYRKAVGAPASFDQTGNQLRAEIKPEVTAQIFWLKCQGGWVEPPRFVGAGDGDANLTLEDLIHLSYQAGKKQAPKAPEPPK